MTNIQKGVEDLIKDIKTKISGEIESNIYKAGRLSMIRDVAQVITNSEPEKTSERILELYKNELKQEK